MFAQFSDSTNATIIGIFYSQQPAEDVPYQAEVAADDPRYAAWWNALPAGTFTTGLPQPTT